MSFDLAIRFEGVGKEYRVGAASTGGHYSYQSLGERLAGALRNPFRAAGQALRRPTSESFWALRDVSFDVRRGEVVGVIGRNGAGKSTLLKILSQITRPSEGQIEVHGRVGSLLEVGTGFHPELTGRENIFLNGAILGMTQREVRAKFDEIVAFSEVERFLDTPVKQYSSGMYTRLAFAVAAHLDPEILVVDEVLAVGDAEFQKKCLGKMQDVASGGRTILFVSHNMAALAALCTTAVLLERGQVLCTGAVDNVISQHVSRRDSGNSNLIDRVKEAKGNLLACVTSASFQSCEHASASIRSGAPATFLVTVHRRTNPESTLHIVVPIRDRWGRPVAVLNSRFANKPLPIGSEVTAEVKIDSVPLVAGTYFADILLFSGGSHLTGDLTYSLSDAISLEVTQNPEIPSSSRQDSMNAGCVALNFEWLSKN